MPIDFPSNPTNGQVYANYIYDSSITAWRNVNTDTGIGTLNAMGLKNVVPTSVNVASGSATVNANGLVTFSGMTSLSLNGLFSSTYRNYKVNFNLNSTTGTGGGLNLRLRSAGTDRTGANYYTSGSEGTAGGTLRSYNNNGNSYYDVCYLYSSSDAYIAGTLEFRDPEISTLMTKVSSNINNLASVGQGATTNTGVIYNTSNTNDGFTIYGSAGTGMTGTIQVFAYNQ